MTTPFVRPDVKMLLDFMAAVPRPPIDTLPISEVRGQMLAGRALLDAPDLPLAVVRDIAIPGPVEVIPARLYDAKATRDAGPVMVFFHGGGFALGDLDTHQSYCTLAATQLDMPVVAVDYRLAPEHPFPAGPDDCEAAARWVAANVPCTGLVLCGDSAGGNLAIVTALALRDAPAAHPVIAMHPIYPVTTVGAYGTSAKDFAEGYFLTTELMHYFDKAYGSDRTSWRAAPLMADLGGLPPTLLVTAGLDPLRDQGRAFAAKLIEAGVTTSYRDAVGSIHGYINFQKAIPSAHADTVANLVLLKAMVAEAVA